VTSCHPKRHAGRSWKCSANGPFLISQKPGCCCSARRRRFSLDGFIVAQVAKRHFKDFAVGQPVGLGLFLPIDRAAAESRRDLTPLWLPSRQSWAAGSPGSPNSRTRRWRCSLHHRQGSDAEDQKRNCVWMTPPQRSWLPTWLELSVM
jgi:hypothetical protein